MNMREAKNNKSGYFYFASNQISLSAKANKVIEELVELKRFDDPFLMNYKH